MARFLRPKDKGMYRLLFDALDGDIQKLSFAEPIPEGLHLPIRILHPRSNYGGGAPVSPKGMPTRMQVSGCDAQIVDCNSAYYIHKIAAFDTAQSASRPSSFGPGPTTALCRACC